jgi:hypothetical protein
VVRLWEHVPIDEAVGTVVTALTATVAPGPADAPGPGESTGPASASDGTEPPDRIPPATDDSLG